MGATEAFTEGNRLSAIHPASRTSAEAFAGWVSMRDYYKAVAIIDVGAIATNGTFDAKLIQATYGDAVTATGVKDITGKAITALGDTDDNSIIVIELDSSELDVDNDYDYINLQINCGGAAAILCQATLIRYDPRFAPVGTDNLAEVVN